MNRRAALIIGGIILIGIVIGSVFIFNSCNGSDGDDPSLTSEPSATTDPADTTEVDQSQNEPAVAPTDPPTETATPTATASPTHTPTSTATSTSTPRPVMQQPTVTCTSDGVEITTQVFPVYHCEHQGGWVYLWYEVEVTYHDGVAVSEVILGGPYTGPWQPGCPVADNVPASGGDGGGVKGSPKPPTPTPP